MKHPPTDEAPEEARRKAALALRVDQDNALSLLLHYLGDSSWRVRKAALSSLPRFLGQSRLVVELVTGLATSNAGLRNACFEALLRIGDASLDALTAALRTSDASQRKFVAEALGALGTERARAALIDALDDPDVNVQGSVAEALGSLGGSDVVAALKSKLTKVTGNLQLSVYLLDALARARAKLPYETLERWVDTDEVARLLYPLLGLSGDWRASEPLIRGLGHSSPGAMRVAIIALAELGLRLDEEAQRRLGARLAERPETRDALDAALGSENDAVATAAIRLLALVRDPKTAPTILRACARRPFIAVGVDAVQSMGAPAVRALLDSFRSLDLETRVLALEVAEWQGDTMATEPLLAIARGGEPRTAEGAVRALGRLGNETVIDALVALGEAHDGSELGRDVGLALSSIGRRYPDAVGAAMRKLIGEENVRPLWLSVLGSLARDIDREHLVDAIRHQDPQVRQAALEAARALGTSFPEDAVILSLADESASVRSAAARALSAYRSKEVVDALLVAVRDPDPWVVVDAVRSLGRVGDVKSADTLLSRATSDVAPVAIAALQALFSMNPSNLANALEKALSHIDSEVVCEAIDCTQRLESGKATALLQRCLFHRFWDVRRAAAEALEKRNLPVAVEIVRERLASESEPMARGSLQQLLATLESER